MAEQEQNRSEQATPYKLSEAKKRGQVAKSIDFSTFVMFSALTATLAISGAQASEALCALSEQLFRGAALIRVDSRGASTALFASLGQSGFHLLLPFLVAAIAAAIVANLVQTGPILSIDPLKPQFERLNPVAGFQRVFNRRALFETLKSVLKLVFLGSIAAVFLLAALPAIIHLGAQAAAAQADWLTREVFALLFRLGLGLLVIALIDIAFVRRQFSRQMMMSRREIKEEVKHREGDPAVRAKIRELQRENRKQARSMGRLPDADVLITNPTHFAVALRYVRHEMNAPIVLAKGSDLWVTQMKAVARQHGIPIIERRRLARLLFKAGRLEQVIPAEAFVDVARIYADLAEIKRSEARYEVVRT